jgi:hypothetical protein
LTCLTVSMIILGMGQEKNPHAQALGSLGGSARAERLSAAKLSKIASEGGKARARKLSAARLSEIAKKAVATRERKRAQAKKGG